jgi:hypothetical protein
MIIYLPAVVTKGGNPEAGYAEDERGKFACARHREMRGGFIATPGGGLS